MNFDPRRWFSRPCSSLDELLLADDVAGRPVWVDWGERSLLTVGLSGAGKGSITANLMREAAPYIRGGLVRVSMVDLKGGMESAFLSGLLEEQADDIDATLALIARLRSDCLDRAKTMAGQSRAHTPTVDSPRRLLVIDEAGEIFRQDHKTRETLRADLQSLLSMGRACGYIVWAMTQDPRMENFPVRNGFTQCICMRVHDRVEAEMVMGKDAVRAGATPWRIPPSRPGTAWKYDEETRRVQLFRVPYIDDYELVHLGEPDLM